VTAAGCSLLLWATFREVRARHWMIAAIKGRVLDCPSWGAPLPRWDGSFAWLPPGTERGTQRIFRSTEKPIPEGSAHSRSRSDRREPRFMSAFQGTAVRLHGSSRFILRLDQLGERSPQLGVSQAWLP
jgi:hypothetical protein